MPKDSQLTSKLSEALGALSATETDDQSRERISSNVPQAVVALAQLGQLVRIRRALERQQFEGSIAEITLNCTDQQQEVEMLENPFFIRSVTVAFINNGPNTAYILINHTNLPFSIQINESYPIDFSRAERRIESLVYWCDTGGTAVVRVKVKY
jgi:hypothetical protein